MTSESSYHKFFPVAVTGTVAGVRSVIVVISFATLVFSGRLSPFISEGIGIALFSGAVFGVVMALGSSYKGTVGLPHSLPTAILAVVAAAAAARLPASVSPEVTFATVVAIMMMTSFLTGAVFLFLGLFRLGEIIRYVPYPVIGGFVAGTGWLLVRGAFGVMVVERVGFFNIGILLDPALMGYWLPGLVFGILLLIVSRAGAHFLVLPGLLLGAVLVFFAILPLIGLSSGEALARGLMLGPFREESGNLFLFYKLGPVDWPVFVNFLPDMVTITVLSTIALLLFASGIELAVERRIDLNRELRAAGLANLLSGVGGGMVGYHVMSQTILTHRLKAASRAVGIISAVFCGLALIFGAGAVSYFPRCVLAGLIIFLGLDFLYEWVIKARRRLPTADYLIVLIILFTVAGFGFLEGIAGGVLAGLMLFVVNYSRVNVVQYAVTGSDYRSNVDRSERATKVLMEQGPKLLILKLRGYIFFGTANNLLNQVRARAYDSELPPLGYVLLDFRLVSGIDSSAVISFIRIQHLAEELQFKLGMSHISKALIDQFEYSGFTFSEQKATFLFDDLDHAMERCENHILRAHGRDEDTQALPLKERLRAEFPSEAITSLFFEYMERKDVPAGEHLMVQGDESEDLFFIESGRVTAELVIADGQNVRLRSMGAGTVVGEIGMYVGFPRTASVVTETQCTVCRLSREALGRMEENDPAAASAFHRFMAKMLAERLAATNRMLRAVLE